MTNYSSLLTIDENTCAVAHVFSYKKYKYYINI